MDDFTQDIQPDEERPGGSLGGRRKHAIDLENRPTRLLSDHVQVKELLQTAQKLALARSVQDTLELSVRALRHHSRSKWAVAWRLTESGSHRLEAMNGIDHIPPILLKLIEQWQDTCAWDEGDYERCPLVMTPIRMGTQIVGGVGIQMQDAKANEDELLTLEFLAALCAVGQAHGQMLTAEEQQREQAQIAKKNQADFLSMVSHDVRGPLSIIKGYAQMITTSRSVIDEARQDEMLGKVMEQSARIERLVNGILDVARSETGKLQLRIEELDVREVVQKAISLVDTEGLYSLQLPEYPVMAQVDSLRIEQIIANLVGNALKYGQAPYTVKVAATAEHWWLDVSDAGEGLSREVEENLFQRFVPGAKNIGLGLSIVQAFVHAHNGSITYSRSERDGKRQSTFHIRLPRRITS